MAHQLDDRLFPPFKIGGVATYASGQSDARLPRQSQERAVVVSIIVRQEHTTYHSSWYGVNVNTLARHTDFVVPQFDLPLLFSYNRPRPPLATRIRREQL